MGKACLLSILAVAAMAKGLDPEKFYSTIRDNNLTELKALLDQKTPDQKANADTPDNRGITPLMYAAEIGSLDAMRLLLDRGADVNAQNAFGSTGLVWAVRGGRRVCRR